MYPSGGYSFIPLYSVVFGVPHVPQFRTFKKSLRHNTFLAQMRGTDGKLCSAMYRICRTLQIRTVIFG